MLVSDAVAFTDIAPTFRSCPLSFRDLEALLATDAPLLGEQARAFSSRVCADINLYESLSHKDPELLEDITRGFRHGVSLHEGARCCARMRN